MNLLQIQKINKSFGARNLLSDASLSVNANEHIGVIGPNGAGKTTLFKIIVGRENFDSGNIVKSKDLRVGYLEQESEWPIHLTGEDYLTEGSLMPVWDLKQIGAKMGLTESHYKVPLKTLSGGFRMRIQLLFLIGQEPDLMLLDEPTNFLDLESILALEQFLRDFKGAFLLISHDREFLKRTTEFTVEVEGSEITKFPGHIDDYFEQKAEIQATLTAAAGHQAQRRKQIQDFIDRFGAKASKARQAQSRQKLLQKMEKIELKPVPTRAHITLPSPLSTGREILALNDVDLGYEGRIILRQIQLRIERGKHLGVVGFNGAGKSTLLKALAGRLPPLKGEVKLGYQVEVSYFAQHVTEELKPDETVIEALQRQAHPSVAAQEVINLAGSLLFSGDAVQKRIRVLSGGEKTRVALGQVLLQRRPVLILDEPTNHLDFDTVEALTVAISNYAGSLLVVSHDRGFIRRVSDQILEIRNGRVEFYPGTYEEYVWSLEKGSLKEAVVSLTDEIKVQKVEPAAPGKTSDSHQRRKKVRELEKEIQKIETTIERIVRTRDTLNQELATSGGEAIGSKLKEFSKVSQDLEIAEAEMLEKMEALELLLGEKGNSS